MTANGPDRTSDPAAEGGPDRRDSDRTVDPDTATRADRITGRVSDDTTSSSTARSHTSGDADSTETTALPRTGSADDSTATTALPRVGGGSRDDDPTSGSSSARAGAGRSTSESEPTTVMRYPESGTGSTGTGTTSAAAAGSGATLTRSPDRSSNRAERDKALGVRHQSTPEDDPIDLGPNKHNTDRFLGSFALFVLRLVTAAMIGVHGAQKLLDIDGTTGFFTSLQVLPYPQVFALVTAIGEVLIALSLVLGLFVRVAGAGLIAVGVGALALVKWTSWPFESGTPGFTGELELLMSAVGLLFLCVGGGWWGVDAAMRRSRARRRAGH